MEGGAVGGVGEVAHFEVVGVEVEVVPEGEPHRVAAVVDALVGHDGEAGDAVVSQCLAARVGGVVVSIDAYIVIIQVGKRPPARRPRVAYRILKGVANVDL